MNAKLEIAARFNEVFLNGKWVVATNYKEQLSSVDWEQAITKIGTFNTIAELTFHISYYISGILNVFENGKLEIKDKFSFDMGPIKSKEDWDSLLNKMWSDVLKLAEHLENISIEKLGEVFIEEKYGNYRRNINALIEHGFYHLGQISLIKKMIT